MIAMSASHRARLVALFSQRVTAPENAAEFFLWWLSHSGTDAAAIANALLIVFAAYQAKLETRGDRTLRSFAGLACLLDRPIDSAVAQTDQHNSARFERMANGGERGKCEAIRRYMIERGIQPPAQMRKILREAVTT